MRRVDDNDEPRFYGELLGYTLRTGYLAYKAGQTLYSALPEMSPPTKTRKSKGKKLRGTQATSSDIAGPQGKGPAVPPMSLGNDTLLGLARSTRRILSLVGGGTLSTGGTGAYAETTLTLNDAYNGGTSAAGYAKYMAFYSKCFVLGSTIVVKAVTTAAASHGSYVGLTTTTNTTSLASATHAISNGMCDWRVIYVNPDRISLM